MLHLTCTARIFCNVLRAGLENGISHSSHRIGKRERLSGLNVASVHEGGTFEENRTPPLSSIVIDTASCRIAPAKARYYCD